MMTEKIEKRTRVTDIALRTSKLEWQEPVAIGAENLVMGKLDEDGDPQMNKKNKESTG